MDIFPCFRNLLSLLPCTSGLTVLYEVKTSISPPSSLTFPGNVSLAVSALGRSIFSPLNEPFPCLPTNASISPSALYFFGTRSTFIPYFFIADAVFEPTAHILTPFRSLMSLSLSINLRKKNFTPFTLVSISQL